MTWFSSKALWKILAQLKIIYIFYVENLKMKMFFKKYPFTQENVLCLHGFVEIPKIIITP